MKNIQHLRQFVRSNGYAWPGGYPMYALCADGEPIDAQATRENYRQILRATRNPDTDRQWEIVGVAVHWEGEPLHCAHSGRAIESAYGVTK